MTDNIVPVSEALLRRADECRVHAEASFYPEACKEYRAKEAAFREAATIATATPLSGAVPVERKWPDSKPVPLFVPLIGSGREPDDMRAYARELEEMYDAATKRNHGWHQIAVAMGYEPNSGRDWPPLPKWLADRVAMYRAQVATPPTASSPTGSASAREEALRPLVSEIVSSLTAAGANRPNLLSINHDYLVRWVERAEAELAQPQDDGAKEMERTP